MLKKKKKSALEHKLHGKYFKVKGEAAGYGLLLMNAR